MAKAPRKSKGDAIARIEALGIASICEKIAGGKTYTDLTEELGIPSGVLGQWIRSDEVRRQRVDAARQESADNCDAMGLRVLMAIRPDSTSAEITQARELANHYRWQAKVRNPASYGEQVNSKVTGSVSHSLAAMTDEELDARIAQLEVLRRSALEKQ